MLEFSIASVIVKFDSPPLITHTEVGFPSTYTVFDMVCPGDMVVSCSSKIILLSSFNFSF